MRKELSYEVEHPTTSPQQWRLVQTAEQMARAKSTATLKRERKARRGQKVKP